MPSAATLWLRGIEAAMGGLDVGTPLVLAPSVVELSEGVRTEVAAALADDT